MKTARTVRLRGKINHSGTTAVPFCECTHNAVCEKFQRVIVRDHSIPRARDTQGVP